MKRRLSGSAFAALCLSLTQFLALGATSAPAQPLPEEVIILGDRSLLQLRTQMVEAEKRAYDLFNTFNDEKRFVISCSISRPTGRSYARQLCQPRFILDASAAHAYAYWENYRAYLDPYEANYTPQVTHQPFEGVVARQQPEYQAKLRQIAEEQPAFREALIAYARMRQEYEQAIRTGTAKTTD